MKNLSLLFIFLSVITLNVFGQENHKSIHQLELEYYNSLNIDAESYYSINQPAEIDILKSSKSCEHTKIVFGWHPYWANGMETNYQWDLLTDMSFFSYEVNPSTGNANSTHGWATSNAVTQALANGVRVNLCVTLFSEHATFFASPTAQQTLITNLINLVQSRGAHGVNIDFEGVPGAQKTNFTNFLIDLCNQMHSAIPNSKVSLCLYAVDWSNVFDIAAINNYIDYYTIMGYDYYYGGSSYAGPTSPLYTFHTFNYNLAKSVNYYMSKGASKEKLILGLPYYGKEWSTESQNVPSATTATGSSRTYKTIRANADGYYTNRQYENVSQCPYYVFYNSGWKQCFVDDEESLGAKYDLVNMMGIAGIGIWALSYDDGYTELWDLIREKFTTCGSVPCNGIFYDLGGPNNTYLNSSDYVFTIAPTGATKVNLEFTEFDIEAGSGSTCNYDYIEIFDGPDESSPSFGRFCNTTGNPGLISSTGNSLCVKVHTDGATVNNGFTGVWSCIQDDILPTTEIIAADWYKEDFTVNFVDEDNAGIDMQFYQVLDFDGNEWRANGNYGFFNDNFNTNIHSDWINSSGIWTINNGHLQQSDQTSANTNIYTNVLQNNENIYLYHWQMKISGEGTNRRAGLYVFCTDPGAIQRGDAYMVYFRADQNKCQLYRSTNNEIVIHTNDNVIVNADTWYDYKVMYNPQTGELKAFQNNILVSSWTDPSPVSSGIAVSLRTGNCIVEYDDIKVYKSRSESALVSVGANKEIRYENQDVNTSACRIKSVVTDINGNFSANSGKDINIDFSAPLQISKVNDGLAEDIDVTYDNSQLQANWTEAVEENSYITNYEYCIGTNIGSNDVVDWTDNGLQTNVTHTGLSLNSLNTYYFTVRAKNIVGLYSAEKSSDGVIFIDAQDNVIADFTISSAEICQGGQVQFINLSQNASTYLWEITGPQTLTSNLESPSFELQAGIYSVSLTAYGEYGEDTKTDEIEISVVPLPIADFEALNTLVQLPNAVVFFENNSQNADSWLWDFGDGTSSTNFEPWHEYENAGVYTISLIAGNGVCEDNEMIKNNYITVEDVSSDKLMLAQEISIYPNPSIDKIFINSENEKINKLELYDINSRLCLKLENLGNTVQLDISEFKDANYILVLFTNENIYKKKLVFVR